MWKRIKTRLGGIPKRFRARKQITTINVKAVSGNVNWKQASDYPEEYRNHRWRHDLTGQSISIKGEFSKKKLDNALTKIMEKNHKLHYQRRTNIKASKIWSKLEVDGQEFDYSTNK